MSDQMNSVMPSLAKKNTQWNKDLIFAMKLARQMLSKNNAEVTPSMGMHLISVQILDPFRKL
jgi:hypothetical protein